MYVLSLCTVHPGSPLCIDELLNKIFHSKLGCKLGIIPQNILAYADDLVILAPSLFTLQHLIDMSFNLCNAVFLKFKDKKSVCIKFRKYKHYSDNINNTVSNWEILH